jgi:predicted transcriptional regulator
MIANDFASELTRLRFAFSHLPGYYIHSINTTGVVVKSIPHLSPAEFVVIKALWSVAAKHSGAVADAPEGCTVHAVRAILAKQGNALAYTTVMTLLGRLATKAAVTVDRTREPFVYHAAVGKSHFLRHRLREFLRDVFDDDAGTLILGLVEDQSLSFDELRGLEDKVAELRQQELTTSITAQTSERSGPGEDEMIPASENKTGAGKKSTKRAKP